MRLHVIQLGPFVLDSPIGRGSLAEVWRARHVDHDLAAAVKVLTGARADDRAFQLGFDNEVRAMAGLNHPNILALFDHGRVGAKAAAASDGALARGAPWLAMELGEGGTVERAFREGDTLPAWEQFLEGLVQLLEGLAHAHAHGLVHRDVKPSNLLICGADGATPIVKLADFDLARAIEPDALPALAETAAGTPHYMAPEQCEGRWRDYGPWTDLYGLGCVAFEGACGFRAFGGRRAEDVVAAHCRGQRRPFAARMPVPEGFEAWIEGMTHREPHSRFQRAADALHALRALGPPDPASVRASDAERRTMKRRSEPESWAVDTQPVLPPWKRTTPRTAQAAAPPPATPEMPDTWRVGPRVADRRPIPRLQGAGLRLYRLRTVPLVDREPERDLLWQALRDVRDEARPKAVVLTGPAGTGKSRLAGWLCERADEVGAAVVLRATHSPSWGLGHGVSAMMARHLRCLGLGRQNTIDHLRAMMLGHGLDDEDEWLAMAELVFPRESSFEPEGPRAVRLSSPRERWVMVQRHLERVARERPVIVLFEDVQWGADALGLARHLLEGAAGTPILVLATARDDLLPARPREARELEALLASERASRVAIGPLDAEHRRALVASLLELEDGLVERVAAHTAGNPMFTIQLVGDWVSRNLLESAPGGLRLKAGTEVGLPDDLHEAWNARVERLIARSDPDDGVALEVAAVLGQEVVTREWLAVCALRGVAPTPQLMEMLLALRMADPDERGPARGWSFAHAMLRESLLRRAREAGRAIGHHRACAQALEDLGGRRRYERCGEHLLLAGELESALEPLLVGARIRCEQGAFVASERLLGLWEHAMDGLERGPDHPQRADGQLLAVRLALVGGRLLEVEELARALESKARERGWQAPLAGALESLGTVARMQGELDRARSLLEEAHAIGETLGDRAITGASAFEIGWVCARSGEFDEARRWLETALADLADLGDLDKVAGIHLGLANVHQQRGDLDAAEVEARASHQTYEQAGSRLGQVSSLNSLGELARLRGDLAQAEAHYRAALERASTAGYVGAIWPHFNLAHTLLLQREYERAEDELEAVIERCRSEGRTVVMGWALAGLAACAAARGDEILFDARLAAAEEATEGSDFIDSDGARLFEAAASSAADAGWPDRAANARELAMAIWQTLERPEEVARLRALDVTDPV